MLNMPPGHVGAALDCPLPSLEDEIDFKENDLKNPGSGSALTEVSFL